MQRFIVNITFKVWTEKKKPTRCNNQMLIINFCLNMFRASLCPSSGEQRPCYCIWCVVLVLLDVVGSGCGVLPCGMWALWSALNMFRASLCPSSGEQRPCVTPYSVLFWFCWMWLVAVVGRCVVGCEHCEESNSNLHSAQILTLCINTTVSERECHIFKIGAI